MLSSTAPVARWYLESASVHANVSRNLRWVGPSWRTGGDEGESSAGVDDAGGVGQDVRGRAESDGLVDAPEFRRG